MTPGLMKMWISFAAIASMFFSVIFIMLSRFKIKNKILKTIVAIIAYVLMIFSGLIIFFVVFSGPVPE